MISEHISKKRCSLLLLRRNLSCGFVNFMEGENLISWPNFPFCSLYMGGVICRGSLVATVKHNMRQGPIMCQYVIDINLTDRFKSSPIRISILNALIRHNGDMYLYALIRTYTPEKDKRKEQTFLILAFNLNA